MSPLISFYSKNYKTLTITFLEEISFILSLLPKANLLFLQLKLVSQPGVEIIFYLHELSSAGHSHILSRKNYLPHSVLHNNLLEEVDNTEL